MENSKDITNEFNIVFVNVASKNQKPVETSN